jgi:ElaB/YqjD/DUF883 family membrane-anchored ribosome-binding protein
MTKTVTKKIAHDVDNALEDVLHELKKAGDRLGDDAQDSLSKAAARLSQAAHGLAVGARTQSRALAKGAVGGVKAHPLASIGVAAAAAALIGLAIAWRSRKAA